MVFGKVAKSRSRVRCSALNQLAEQLRVTQELRSEGPAQFIKRIREFSLKVFGQDGMCNRPANNCKVFRPSSLRTRSAVLSVKFLECSSNMITVVLGVLPAGRESAERRPIFFAGVLVPNLSRIDGPSQKMAMRRARILQPFMDLLAEFGDLHFSQVVFKSIEDWVRARLIEAKLVQFRKMRPQLLLPIIKGHRTPQYSGVCRRHLRIGISVGDCTPPRQKW